MEVTLTNQNFNEEVLGSTLPVLVDFWATWCGPCRMLAPVLEEVAEEYAGKLKVCKVNVDEEPELCFRFSVSSIPTLLVFKDGKLVNSGIGYMPKDALVQLFA